MMNYRRKEMSGNTVKSTSVSNGFLAFLSGEFREAETFFRDAYNSGIETETVIQNLILSLLKQEKVDTAFRLVNSELKKREEKKVDLVKREWLILLKFLILIRMGKVVEAFEELHEKLASEVLTCDLEQDVLSSRRTDTKGRERFWNFRLKITLMDIKVFPYFNASIQSFLLKILDIELGKELPPEEKSFLLSYQALLALSLGEMDRALEIVNATIDKKETYLSLVSRGKIYYQIGRLSDAYGAFIRAKNLTDDNPEALINMGVVLVKSGDYQRGLDYINQGLKKGYGSYSGWKNRALTLLASREWDKALKTISVIRKMREDKPELWLWSGIAYLGLKENKKALETLLRYKGNTKEKNEWASVLVSLAKNLGK